MEYHLLLVEVPQFEVSFDLDANGILNMSAQDKPTAGSRIVLLAMAKAVTNLSELEVPGGWLEARTDREHRSCGLA